MSVAGSSARNLEYIQCEIDSAQMMLHAEEKRTGASVNVLPRRTSCWRQRGDQVGSKAALACTGRNRLCVLRLPMHAHHHRRRIRMRPLVAPTKMIANIESRRRT